MIPRFPLRLEQERKGAGTMQKLSQTEELARELAAHARRHTVTSSTVSPKVKNRHTEKSRKPSR